MKPSAGFAMFCELYQEETDRELKRLRTAKEKGEGEREAAAADTDSDIKRNKRALLKIKKTFKNKHFTKKRFLLLSEERRCL